MDTAMSAICNDIGQSADAVLAFGNLFPTALAARAARRVLILCGYLPAMAVAAAVARPLPAAAVCVVGRDYRRERV